MKITFPVWKNGQVTVGSNKTILGVGAYSGLTGGGMGLEGVSNVIIRNLTISFAKGNLCAMSLCSRVFILVAQSQAILSILQVARKEN